MTMLRQKMIACAIALVCCSFSVVATASAETIGTCDMTGYTFMGGGMAYTSTPEDPSAKDYFLGQSLNYGSGDDNYWGYGWTKFSVGTSTVTSAYLTYDLLGVGAMAPTPASPTNPAYLDLYDPNVDVASLATQVARQTLRDYLDSQPCLSSETMTSNGVYSVDITSLYNGWVTGAIANNGLVFSALDNTDNAGKYASFGNASGSAPYISTSSVPEPSTLMLLAVGAGALAVWVRRRRAS